MSNISSAPTPQGKDCRAAAASLLEAGKFWAIWLHHQEYLFRLSLRWMRGNRSEAEEALSSAKLKAALHYQLKPGSVLDERAWLSRLLHNVCVDIYRRREFLEQTGVENFEVLVEVLQAKDPEASPEGELVRRELHYAICEMLKELSPSWRSAFIERCLKERSYSEIAREQGTSQANVRKRVQLARSQLRQLLRADFAAAFTSEPS